MNKIKKFVIKEIEKRYEAFPNKEQFTEAEIIAQIIQNIEQEAKEKDRIKEINDRKFLHYAYWGYFPD